MLHWFGVSMAGLSESVVTDWSLLVVLVLTLTATGLVLLVFRYKGLCTLFKHSPLSDGVNGSENPPNSLGLFCFDLTVRLRNACLILWFVGVSRWVPDARLRR